MVMKQEAYLIPYYVVACLAVYVTVVTGNH